MPAEKSEQGNNAVGSELQKPNDDNKKHCAEELIKTQQRETGKPNGQVKQRVGSCCVTLTGKERPGKKCWQLCKGADTCDRQHKGRISEVAN